MLVLKTWGGFPVLLDHTYESWKFHRNGWQFSKQSLNKIRLPPALFETQMNLIYSKQVSKEWFRNFCLIPTMFVPRNQEVYWSLQDRWSLKYQVFVPNQCITHKRPTMKCLPSYWRHGMTRFESELLMVLDEGVLTVTIWRLSGSWKSNSARNHLTNFVSSHPSSIALMNGYSWRRDLLWHCMLKPPRWWSLW